jgi:integrase
MLKNLSEIRYRLSRRLPGFCAKAPVGSTSTGRSWAAGSSEVLYFSPARRTFMSVYSKSGKGWRYDFTHKGVRHTEAWFKTKREAMQAEAKKREEVQNPAQVKVQRDQEEPTDMGFLELVNLRLDFLQARRVDVYYKENVYKAKQWVRLWGKLECGEISQGSVERFLLTRRRVSAETANKEIRYLKATFNWGIKRKYISTNPVDGIEFFPEGSKLKYVPSAEEIDKVISVASKDQRDYLLAIRETLGRSIEINRLTWKDVLFGERCVVLYTRKKKGGHLKPRKIPMTQRLYEVLKGRYENRDKDKPWVFWHRYWSRVAGEFVEGPYRDRKRFMRALCKKAGVPCFRFHPIRHSGASTLDHHHVPMGSIQRLLGHENRTTTEIYLHSVANSERDAIRILELVREKSHTDSHTATKKG